MVAIPLPLLPPSTSPHLLLRRFPLLLRRTSLISSATPPPHVSTTTSFLPRLSSHSLSVSSTSFIPHSLSTSKKLLHPLNDAALEPQTINEDKVVDSKPKNENKVLAVNDNSDSEGEDEDNVEDSDDESEKSETNLLGLNDVVLEEEIDNCDSGAEDEDKVEDSDDESENESNNSKTNLFALNDVVLEEEIDSDKEAENEDNSKMNTDVVLEEETDDFEFEAEDEVEKVGDNSSKKKVLGVNAKAGPIMSIKEKKELASYAHSLGKELRSQQVGKSGVTDTVITALIETLEKRELLKLKIHANCPAELDDAIKQIEMGTGSVAVSQIGRTVILYRPSVSKLQAEQKKKEARRKLMKKRPAWVRSSSQSKEELPKLTARGRRGSSRV